MLLTLEHRRTTNHPSVSQSWPLVTRQLPTIQQRLLSCFSIPRSMTQVNRKIATVFILTHEGGVGMIHIQPSIGFAIQSSQSGIQSYPSNVPKCVREIVRSHLFVASCVTIFSET